MEKLEAGKFEDKLIQSVMGARNFVLVLSAGALDKCKQDHDCKDWVHKVGADLCGPIPPHLHSPETSVAQLQGRSHSSDCNWSLVGQ